MTETRPGAGARRLICWFDAETTGTHADAELLEVAARLTDEQLAPVGGPFHRLLPATEAMLRFDLSHCGRPEDAEWVERTHRETGLWDEVVDLADRMNVDSWSTRLPHVDEVDQDLSDWLDKAADGAEVSMGGLGVASYDRPRCEEWLPLFAQRLTYWSIDVSAARRVLTNLCGVRFEDVDSRPPLGKRHRASEDVDDALTLARMTIAAVRDSSLDTIRRLV